MYNEKEVKKLKEYYLDRERFYQLGVLVSLLVGYLIGLIS